MNESKKASVFIVDDTKSNLDILVEALSDDYEVSVAFDGKTAIKFIKEYTPDLILLDIIMKDMNGYEVCKILKSDPFTKNIPIIFLTAMDEISDKTKGFKLGAVDYITKPFEVIEVKERIKIHLELNFSRELLKNQNKILEKKVIERIKEIEVMKDVLISSLASIVETRDSDTGAHIYRTQNYVKALAEELAKEEKYASLFTEAYIHLLYKTSPLHDIGKIGVSDVILLKPGKLTVDEMREMKKHAEYGYEILQKIELLMGKNEFISIAKDIACFHHERWDGKGYPKGLKEEEIPISARLMALADVYDALTSKRVYKPAFSHEKAKKILLSERGKLLDPLLIDIFLRIEDKFIEISKI